MALGRQVDIAINHDPDAILMHKTNHPKTLHLTEDIFNFDAQDKPSENIASHRRYLQGRFEEICERKASCFNVGES